MGPASSRGALTAGPDEVRPLSPCHFHERASVGSVVKMHMVIDAVPSKLSSWRITRRRALPAWSSPPDTVQTSPLFIHDASRRWHPRISGRLAPTHFLRQPQPWIADARRLEAWRSYDWGPNLDRAQTLSSESSAVTTDDCGRPRRWPRNRRRACRRPNRT